MELRRADAGRGVPLQFSAAFISRQISRYIVIKQREAPVTWLISSAQNTPFTPRPAPGSSSVSGATSTTLRSMENISVPRPL